jgi:hypothetical protein
MSKISYYAKFVAAILAAAAVAVVQYGVPLPPGVQQWLSVAVAVIGAISVYAIPNRQDVRPLANPDPDDDDGTADGHVLASDSGRPDDDNLTVQ